jgi:hypothetical protein
MGCTWPSHAVRRAEDHHSTGDDGVAIVTATLARRVRAVLIGVLTILALTGASARVVRLVVHHQTLRRQVLGRAARPASAGRGDGGRRR